MYSMVNNLATVGGARNEFDEISTSVWYPTNRLLEKTGKGSSFSFFPTDFGTNRGTRSSTIIRLKSQPSSFTVRHSE